jgi:ATP-dependent Clp protease protease subunit
MHKNIVNFPISPAALDRWNPGIKAVDSAGINIFGEIGWDVKLQDVADKLEGAGDVQVNINSIGGNLFDGIAIYNLLREHPGQVKVRVLGMAASAASIIAMAGDEVEIGASGWLMIHNAITGAYGNKDDLRAVAAFLEPFDKTIAEIYAERTGLKTEEIVKLLDAETWISGKDAVEYGYADSLMSADKVEEEDAADKKAAAKMDVILARAGLSRSDRRKLMKEFKSTSNSGSTMPSADTSDMQNAVAEIKADIEGLKSIFSTK